MSESICPPQGGYKGFIPLSREAYKQLHRKYGKQPATEIEAYCILMANVNYRESSLMFRDKPVVCPVGDSFKSLDTWKRLFRWSKTRVRRFFLSLQVLGLIEYSAEASHVHIHVVDYLPNPTEQAEKRDRQFELFWDAYHDTTQMPRRSIGKAKREWVKLSAGERELAIRRIPYYYEGLNNTKYCKQAAGYLADKCFLDEE